MKFSIKTLEKTDSTQDVIKDLGAKGTPEGAVIHALEQLKGRGRQGKVWHSPVGNLYMSVLLRPECLADDVPQLAFVSGLAISAALETYLPAGHVKTLKWPNDVFVDGKKISGVLTETTLVRGRVDCVAVGIGINVSAPPEGAISLDTANGRENSIEGLRDTVLESLARHYRAWQNRGFEVIRAAWVKQAHGIGEPIIACLPDSEIKGIFRGVDEQGWLVMEDRSGNERHIKAGHIEFKSQ
ncbi:MAG: biotin--[acetyl-CoA-carboxylase] ligase [Alphaproteobacteria bacterium]|nr:biotin--[acetyl-CoA-carboxylase] ligase [Alphaproteobacteria bacterium]